MDAYDDRFFRELLTNVEISNEYSEALERLKIEFGEFIKFAEDGKSIRYSGLKARKQSIILRNLLKGFRKISVANEKRINDIMKNVKEEISKT